MASESKIPENNVKCEWRFHFHPAVWKSFSVAFVKINLSEWLVGKVTVYKYTKQRCLQRGKQYSKHLI